MSGKLGNVVGPMVLGNVAMTESASVDRFIPVKKVCPNKECFGPVENHGKYCSECGAELENKAGDLYVMVSSDRFFHSNFVKRDENLENKDPQEELAIKSQSLTLQQKIKEVQRQEEGRPVAISIRDLVRIMNLGVDKFKSLCYSFRNDGKRRRLE
jgi:hypothetical protein